VTVTEWATTSGINAALGRIGAGDFSGDGRGDVLWRHATRGEVWLWPMNGTTVLSETNVATVDPAYDIVGTGDYNGDGKSDILWRQLTNGRRGD
jgi:hypothetical protein